jgi:hypothetical protein
VRSAGGLEERFMRTTTVLPLLAGVFVCLPAHPASALPIKSFGVSSSPATSVAPSPRVTIPTTITTGLLPATLGTPPQLPSNYSIQTTASTVTVSWYPGGTDASEFILWRLDMTGAWQQVFSAPYAPREYTWVDTDQSLSIQCYSLEVVGANLSSWTQEGCVVRPDPMRFPQFPQNPPAPTIQWRGLSNVNDKGAPLFNVPQNDYLEYQSQDPAVSLGWGIGGSLLKLERQGVNNYPLLIGEPLALRVWGGGWLVHQPQTFGVDLALSETPSYEWYVLGQGYPSGEIDWAGDGGPGNFALWNRSAQDYLVQGGEAWGINLNWYKNTLGIATPPRGCSSLVVTNCIHENRPLEMWVLDETAGSGWQDMGTLEPQWGPDYCPETGDPWTFNPTAGHTYLIEGVDFTADGCDDSPTNSCERTTTQITGDPNGLACTDPAG